MRSLALGIAAVVTAATAGPVAAADPIEAAFVVMGSDGQAVARVVTGAAAWRGGSSSSATRAAD